jgi:undecaprenyl-phosphate galactose phosphotransferase
MVIARRMNRLKNQAEFLAIFFVDILSVVALFYLSAAIRTELLPQDIFSRSLVDIWWIFLIWIFFFYYEGLYTKRFSFWDEIKALCIISFFSTVGVFTIVSIGKLSDEISRTVVILMGLPSIVFLPFIRISFKKIVRRLGFFKRRVLILGAGETGRLIASALKREPNYGYDVIGFLDDDPEKFGKRIDGIKIHRGIDKSLNYINRCNIEDIFIAMPGAGKERLQGLINNLQHKVGRILFVPDIFGIAVLGTNLQHFFHEEVLAFEIENNLSNPFNMFIKRSFDLFVSAILIPVVSIPMAFLAILIRLDSKGRAIFSQERIGEKGRIFRCFKFRTMYGDADERLSELFKKDPGAKTEWEHSLDELPQIFNVLIGEMSLVGPRPYLPREKQVISEHDHTLLLTKPGITGLWQVSGRSNTGHDYRINLDLWYVRNWNIWLDIVILFKTMRIVVKREGAY